MSYFPDSHPSPSMDSGYSSGDGESMAATEDYTQFNDLATLDPPSFQVDHFDTSMTISEMYTEPTDLASLNLPSFQADHFDASEMYTQPNDLASFNVPSCQVDPFDESTATFSEMYTQPNDLVSLNVSGFQFDHPDASMATFEMYTQPNDLAILDLPSCKAENFETVPRPENRYIIIETASGKALHIANNELILAHNDKLALGLLWLCVKAENCIGFFNEETGMYVGYNNDMVMPVETFDPYAYFTLKPHIDGGYMLQTDTGRPEKQGAVSFSNHQIVIRQHAGASFAFVKIDERFT